MEEQVDKSNLDRRDEQTFQEGAVAIVPISMGIDQRRVEGVDDGIDGHGKGGDDPERGQPVRAKHEKDAPSYGCTHRSYSKTPFRPRGTARHPLPSKAVAPSVLNAQILGLQSGISPSKW